MPAGLTGYLWLKGGHPGLPGFSCPLRALTGIPCPTCFLTRAAAASLRGDWSTALAQHALGPLLAAGLVAWSVQALRQRQLRLPRLRGWQVISLLALLTAYWSGRLLLQYGLGIAAFPQG